MDDEEPQHDRLRQIKGCLLGGAVGDALGAPVEFMRWREIESCYGQAGITEYPGPKGYVTDDTQMMLFTAEGLLRADVRYAAKGICHAPSVVHHALLRWLITQGEKPKCEVGRDGWLIGKRRLFSRRAPGNTCLSALRAVEHFGQTASNNSKGCGAVMRSAPCAFFGSPFNLAVETAQLTHGHPAGYLSAGLFADILARLLPATMDLEAATRLSLETHVDTQGIEAVTPVIERVLDLHRHGVMPDPTGIANLGGGWVGEEALAIGLWCALAARDFAHGVIMAVNHDGDSDSTGLIAGHFLGLIHGPESIPATWIKRLDLRDIVEQIATDLECVPRLYDGEDGPYDDEIWTRYPGW